MPRISPGVAGGFAVGAAAVIAAVFTLATGNSPATTSTKAARLPTNNLAPMAPKRIAVVEVVGIHDAAIVYRDREGKVLFSTDPVANVTMVSKNLALPEVTVRDSKEAEVERVPIENMRSPEGKEAPPTQGCESGLSPDISPTVPVTKGRCVVELQRTGNVASLH
jgi:hypothetical protein